MSQPAANKKKLARPRTRKQALNSSFARQWEAAMAQEFESLKEQAVFKIVPRPPPPTVTALNRICALIAVV